MLTQPEELLAYELDGAHDRQQPDALVFITSAEHVQAVVRLARGYGLPVTARGAGTGLSGGALPHAEGVLSVLARLRRILEVSLEGSGG